MLDLDAQAQTPPFRFSQTLLDALSDDRQRSQLYAQLRQSQQVLVFQSQADARDNLSSSHAGGHAGGDVPVFHQDVALLTTRAHIEQALSDGQHFSNSAYKPLGSGTFMLALDGAGHALQRGLAVRLLRPYTPEVIAALIGLAWQTAAVLPLKTRSFNAAALAEQVALRFAGFLFGHPFNAHPVLEASMRSGYQHLVYQIVGRHFVFQPQWEAGAKLAGARFMMDTTELLGQYLRGQVPDDIQQLQRRLPGFEPLCQRAVAEDVECSLTELGVLMGGLMAGIVGNIQASVAIALDHLLDASPLAGTFAQAHAATPGSPSRADLTQRVLGALALNPPAALLPRQVIADVTLRTGAGGREAVTLKKGMTVLLALGSGTQERLAGAEPKTGTADPLIYGGGHLHHCLGDVIATPLVVEIVRRVLMLPGLTRALNPATGAARRLEKTWGFRCEQMPLEYAQDVAMVQQPLAIVMAIKAPVAANAALLATVIAVGAPRIEFKLAESHQVHFAWFMLLENNTKLALFTTFDGSLDAYLRHFALEVGSLFDKLFECLEDPPPLPVAEHPDAFVAKVRQFNQAPLGHYFFSAYPQHGVSAVQAALKRDAQ